MEKKFISFEEAKEALVNYFSEESIEEDFGYTQEQFDEFINDFNSPLYELGFIQETALCFDFLSRVDGGYLAEYNY